mmetsp:Transcript_15602/g.34083  ORF Transcript_15602/g.34083 Transcript_15602/m.34083 type:complete len:220 (+) Transcript_15602:2164-2823(+)
MSPHVDHIGLNQNSELDGTVQYFFQPFDMNLPHGHGADGSVSLFAVIVRKPSAQNVARNVFAQTRCHLQCHAGIGGQLCLDGVGNQVGHIVGHVGHAGELFDVSPFPPVRTVRIAQKLLLSQHQKELCHKEWIAVCFLVSDLRQWQRFVFFFLHQRREQTIDGFDRQVGDWNVDQFGHYRHFVSPRFVLGNGILNGFHVLVEWVVGFRDFLIAIGNDQE